MVSLVVGASGQVGEHCLAALPSAAGTCHEHVREGLVPLDIRDLAQFDALVADVRPDVIYMPASVANVDRCEEDPVGTWEINVRGVQNAVQVANRYRCKLVYLSTEYVFDGTEGPYDETAAPNPICVYGAQKLAAERVTALHANDWLILRTAVVYSWESQGKNFVYRLINTLRDGKPLNAPVDQISSPTYAPDLVAAMIQLATQGERGIFNVTGSHVASRYEFATTAARVFGLEPSLIQPVTTAELKQRAPRPLRTGLLVGKVERAIGRRMLDFETGLQRMASAR